MTNFDRWMLYTDALEAADDFVEMAWYFAVGAALERRVWYGDFSRPMFCAPYVLFVGPPGKGKGSSMREAFKLLSRYPAKNPDGTTRYCRDNPKEPEPRFFSLPDTTTFEDLVHTIADHTVPFETPTGDIYVQSSTYFGLEELSSLMRRNKAEDVARFLLNMYDNVPYTYSTRSKGKARIRNASLSLLAGTQVDFIRKCEKDGLVGEGLISRFLLVYAEDKRKTLFEYPPLTEEQAAARDHCAMWLYHLGTIFGRIQPETDADKQFLEDWWKAESEYLERFIDSKLGNYFERRKDHLMKLAAARHFSESDSLLIPRHAFEWAIDRLRHYENGAIRIAQKAGRNQSFPLQERLVNFVKIRPRTNAEVYRFLESDMDLTEIMNTLKLLEQGRRIVMNENDVWVYVPETTNMEINKE